jgi:hypothetical protein
MQARRPPRLPRDRVDPYGSLASPGMLCQSRVPNHSTKLSRFSQVFAFPEKAKRRRGSLTRKRRGDKKETTSLEFSSRVLRWNNILSIRLFSFHSFGLDGRFEFLRETRAPSSASHCPHPSPRLSPWERISASWCASFPFAI